MTTDQLYQELNYVNGTRQSRLKYAGLILDTPSLLPELLDVLFMVDDKISCRAAWVFEFVCNENLEICIPYLDRFIENIHKVHLDSAVRPVAKVCDYLITAYYAKKDDFIKKELQPKYRERIIENCFDWMINDGKMAPKVYAMNALFLLGKDYDWIHPELASILERDYQVQSPGFRARAKHILNKINKE